MRHLTIVLVIFNMHLSTGFLGDLTWGKKQVNGMERLFNGAVKPIDPNVCETQSITFTSTLQEAPIVNYSIGFEVKNRTTNRTYVPVERDRINVVNDTVSEFIIYNLTFETTDMSKTDYIYVKSYYWQDFSTKNSSLQLGYTSSARVFPLPKKVKDFKCVVHNYASMVCTWKYGKSYGENMPNVTFQWRNLNLNSGWSDCKKLDTEGGTCRWDSSTDGYFKDSNLTMTIKLDQKCGISVSSDFDIDTTKIVKPGPVQNISATVKSSQCIHLSWETSYLRPYDPTNTHRIIVSSKYDIHVHTILYNTSQEFSHTRNICHLYPYTEYTFSISVKPASKYSGYWSEPEQIVAITYSDVPRASPQLVEGGYTFNHMDCHGIHRKRRVCVFWKPIGDEQKCGPMLGINGVFTAISDNNTKQTLESWAEDSTYGCSVLECTKEYDVIIQARNVNGTSKGGHPLKIPKYIPAMLPPQFKVESDNISNVYVSWDRSEQIFTTGYTVAWCRNKNGECESTRMVNWKFVSSDTPEVILRINSSAQDFLYGVSASTETGSTGVTWQDCVYGKNAVPKREPQNVGVSTGSEDNTLLVTWDKLTCQIDEPYISLYNVKYWKQNGGNPKSRNISASGEAKILLTYLETDKTYMVTVRGVTEEGHYGPESQSKTGVPVNKSLSPAEISGIVIAATVCVLLAGIGIFCAIRRCKQKADRVLKQAGKITIPAQPDQDLMAITRQNSDDSGCIENGTPSETTDNRTPLETTGNRTPLETTETRTPDTINVKTNVTENGYIPADTIPHLMGFTLGMSTLHETDLPSDTDGYVSHQAKHDANSYISHPTEVQIHREFTATNSYVSQDVEVPTDTALPDDNGYILHTVEDPLLREDVTHETNEHVSHSVEVRDLREFCNSNQNEVPLPRKSDYIPNDYISVPVEVPAGRELAHETNGNVNHFGSEATNGTKFYVSLPIEELVSKELAHETNDKVSRFVEVPVFNKVRDETNRDVKDSIKLSVSQSVDVYVRGEVTDMYETNLHVSHPVAVPVSLQDKNECNGYVAHTVESPVDNVFAEKNGHVPSPVGFSVLKEAISDSNGYVVHTVESSVDKVLFHHKWYASRPETTGINESNGYVAHTVESPDDKVLPRDNGYVYHPDQVSVPRDFV